MIYIECDADEVLLRELGFSRKQFVHLGGKFEICKRLEKTQNAIGLIEYDSGKSDPIYLSKCSIAETNDQHGIKIYFHKTSGNRLFVLHNDLEDWILKISKNNEISVQDFGLENDRDRMHRLMPGKLINFGKLVSHLLQKEIATIKYLQAKLRS